MQKKLTTPEFPEPIGAGSLDFSEQYLSHLYRKYLMGKAFHSKLSLWLEFCMLRT